VVVVAPSDIVTRHISYADLNLAATAGERTLNRRVSGAVSGLCLEALGGRDTSLEFKYSMINCSTATWGQARPQVALAVQRARDIASSGTSPIAAAAITVILSK
jgi:UrcA family protein